MRHFGHIAPEQRQRLFYREPMAFDADSPARVLAAALGATLYSPWSFLVLVIVGGGLATWEWGRLTRGNGFDATALISAVTVGAVAVLISLRRPDLAALILAAASAAIFVTQPARSQSGWSVAGLLYVALPVAAGLWPSVELAILDRFYRAGWLVFGGGHVVLPLLQAEVVPPGWVTNDSFLAGYGAAQAVPGPLFTFAAYLGAVMQVGPGGWLGGLLCLMAVFLPSFLLVVGALPLWQRLRANAAARSALAGINAAVVGLLLAALYDPVWVSAIRSGTDFALALAAFVLLAVWRVSPWIVVVTTAAIAAVVL